MVRALKKRKKFKRVGSKPKFEAINGAKHCFENKLCVECGSALSGRRTRWCGDSCVSTYFIRSSPTEARRAVHRRDKGICAACGFDANVLEKEVWEALKDHYAHRSSIKRARKKGRTSLKDIIQPILAVLGLEVHWKRRSFWDMDHIVELADGGENELGNLQTLCLPCHKIKTVESARRRSKAP